MLLRLDFTFFEGVLYFNTVGEIQRGETENGPWTTDKRNRLTTVVNL